MPGKILSSEKVASSDVESDSSSSESESGSSGSVEAPISQKRKQPTTTSERTSSPQSAAKRTKTAQEDQATKPASSSESSSEDDGDQQMKETTTNALNSLVSSRAISKDYTPPDGFVAVKSTSKSTDTELDKLFSPANLAGKQIWHITLASGLPITSLKEVDLTQAQSGTTIIKHNGLEYGLRVESSADTGKDGSGILVPVEGGVRYNSASVTINTTLHVQQSTHPATAYSIPKDKTNDTQGVAHPTIPKAKAVRQQPKGLRMRYWPAGFESGGPDMSQTETSAKGRPETLGLTEAAAKRGETSSSSETSSDSDDEL